MAVRYEESATPKGHPLLKMFVNGHVDLAQAETMADHITAGKKFHRQRVLVVVAEGTEYTPDARKYFPTLQGDHYAMATIVTSAILRAVFNLISRVAGGTRNFKMFTDEAAALAWLDTIAE